MVAATRTTKYDTPFVNAMSDGNTNSYEAKEPVKVDAAIVVVDVEPNCVPGWPLDVSYIRALMLKVGDPVFKR